MPVTASLPDRLATLRAEVAALSATARPVLPFRVHEIDQRLAAGGLGTDQLHEFAAASSASSDDAAATLFVAGLAARLAETCGRTVLWAVTRFDLYAPGLEQVGLSAAQLLFAEASDDAGVLAVAEDGIRAGSLAAVVVEVRKAGMTATRRLQLAASEGGAPVLLLRRRQRAGACPLEEPSAAATRWRIGCASSAPLGVPGVGRARWAMDLVRQRGGVPFSLLLEACDDQGRLALPAAARDRAAPADRAVARAA